MKYFEFQLEKQRKAAEETALTQEESGKRVTSEKNKKKKQNKSVSLIPERKKYEMLCRGEGLKMVRKKKQQK